MIKHETISIEGTVIYCDNEDCGKRGPQEAYDNADDVLAAAEQTGWTVDENDRDLCPKCSTK